MMAFSRRGQGATEYLVLLAVVLVIALVAIALLGFFPSLAVDARITQSNAYWRGEARPFAIIEHTFSSTTGNGTVVLQNTEATGPLTLTAISIGNCTTATPNAVFAPGDTRAVNITGCPTSGLYSGAAYDFTVVINYTSTTGGTGAPLLKTQYGTKNIVGKYT